MPLLTALQYRFKGGNGMICGQCGSRMLQGEFRMEQRSIDSGIYRAYPVAAWYENGEKIFETPINRTLGFYCAECGAMVGIFTRTKPVGFAGRYKADLDDSIDRLPYKICPECGLKMDIDYPRCPECGLVFEAI